MVTPQDKQIVEARVNTFEQLLEQDEFVKKQRALGEARGKREQAQKMFLLVVKTRFPALTALATIQSARVTNIEVLQETLEKLVTAPDEVIARTLLEALPMA